MASEPNRKIVTTHIYPPIPIRTMDWCAHFDGDEPDDNGNMRFIGWGRTKEAAIQDLQEQWEADQPYENCPICGQKNDVNAKCSMGGCPIGGDQ